jgi:hypothetical protein
MGERVGSRPRTFQGAFLELHLNFCLNDRLKFEAIVEMAI